MVRQPKAISVVIKQRTAMTRTIGLVIGLLMCSQAVAGYGIGTVGQVMVGRLGTQVYVEIRGTFPGGFACTVRTDGLRYAFLLSNSGGKEMLATILAAKATGGTLQVVGAGTCSQDPGLEDVSYVTAQ